MEPDTVIRVRAHPIIASAVGPQRIAIAEIEHPKVLARTHRPRQAAGAPTVPLRIRTIKPHKGRSHTVCTLRDCDLDNTHLNWLGHNLVVVTKGRFVALHRSGRQLGDYRMDGATPSGAPLVFGDVVYCLWEGPGKGECWIARWSLNSPMRKARVPGRQVLNGIADGAGIALRISEKGGDENCPLVLVDPQSLETTTIDVGWGRNILATTAHLFVDEKIAVHVEPSISGKGRPSLAQLAARPYDTFTFYLGSRDEAGALRDDGGFTMHGTRPQHAITCFERTTMRRVKRWEVGCEVAAMRWHDAIGGLLITLDATDHNEVFYGLLTPHAPSFCIFGGDDGCSDGQPIMTAEGALCLGHMGGNHLRYCDWLSDPIEISPRIPALWRDPRNDRVRGESKSDDNWYFVDHLDFQSRQICRFHFHFAAPALAMYMLSSKLIFVTGSAVIIKQLGVAPMQTIPMDETAMAAVRPTTSLTTLYGSPLSGPKDDLWGRDSRLPILVRILGEEPEDVCIAVNNDRDARLRYLVAARERLEFNVLDHWPDIFHQLVRALPDTLADPSRADARTAARFVAWEVAMLRKSRQPWLDDRVRDSGVLLFQIYIWQRMVRAAFYFEETPELLQSAGGGRADPFATALSWFCVAAMPTPGADAERRARRADTFVKSSKFAGVAALVCGAMAPLFADTGWFTKSLWSALMLAIVAALLWLGGVLGGMPRMCVERPEISSAGFLHFREEWPNGPPLAPVEPERYVKFRTQLVECGLVAGLHRSRLQSAIARVRETLREGPTVFLSYSTLNGELALSFANALKRWGVRVVLDRWELKRTAPDWEVEAWIAERMFLSDGVVFFVTPSAVASGWVNREAQWDWRLLSVKDSLHAPYLIFVEGDAPTNYVSGHGFGQRELSDRGIDRIADSIALRVIDSRRQSLLSWRQR